MRKEGKSSIDNIVKRACFSVLVSCGIKGGLSKPSSTFIAT